MPAQPLLFGIGIVRNGYRVASIRVLGNHPAWCFPRTVPCRNGAFLERCLTEAVPCPQQKAPLHGNNSDNILRTAG